MKLNLSEDDKNKAGFYLICNPRTDETYVGSTFNLGKRSKDHKSRLLNNRHCNERLQKAYNLDPDNFEFIAASIDELNFTIEDNKNLAMALEQSIINENLNNPLLLNIAKDVVFASLGYTHNKESLKKISDASKARLITDETRARMSESAKGHQRGLGYKHTVEAKKIMSEKLKGNKFALNHRHSEETRAQIAASHTGVKISEEAIKKSAEGRTKRRVVIDSVIYQNASVAAKVIGLSREGINKRCLSNNFKNYCFKEKQ